MLIAVLARHAGLNLSSHDVYVNVAGGLRIDEPAADPAAPGPEADVDPQVLPGVRIVTAREATAERGQRGQS